MNTLLRSASILLLAAMTGCTSMQPLSSDCRGGSCTAVLSAGDDIVVQTTNQGTLALKVTSVQSDQIVGRTQTRPARDVVITSDTIENLQKRQFSSGRTAGAVVGTGIATAAVIVIIGAAGLAAALVAM